MVIPQQVQRAMHRQKSQFPLDGMAKCLCLLGSARRADGQVSQIAIRRAAIASPSQAEKDSTSVTLSTLPVVSVQAADLSLRCEQHADVPPASQMTQRGPQPPAQSTGRPVPALRSSLLRQRRPVI